MGHCPDQARWAVWFRPLGRRGGMRSAVASGAAGLSFLGGGWDEGGYSAQKPTGESRYGEKRENTKRLDYDQGRDAGPYLGYI